VRGLFWLLGLFALAVGASLAARYNDGYVLLVFPPYRAEVSLNLAIVLIIVGFAALYAALRAGALALSLPKRAREFRQRQREQRGAQSFQDAVRLLFEGRFGQALKNAAAAHAAGESPQLAALVAARAAQRMRDPQRQQEWLARIDDGDKHLQAARLMLEAEMHLDRGRPAEAIVVLHRLQQIAGRHLAALRLELRAQQAMAQWDETLRLVRLLEKRETLSATAAAEIRLHAHRENVRVYRNDLPQLLDYRRRLPREEMTPRLALAFAEAFVDLGASDEAERLIATQLDTAWPQAGSDAPDDRAGAALLRIYGELSGGEATARIARAESWLTARPDDAALLLVLGRLCLTQRLWGKAQSYLEAALARSAALSPGDHRRARLALARLFEDTGRTEEAMPHYRAAAQLVG